MIPRKPARLIFINRYFFPDHSATSQILSDLAFHLAGQGRDVHVIASRQRYDDAGAGLPRREKIGGVHVHRVSTSRFGRGTIAGRALDYLSFHAAAAWRLLMLAGPKDVVIANTDPPLLSVLAGMVSRLRGFRRVNWLQDLYPEIAAELGVVGGGAASRTLLALRDHSLAPPAITVAVGEDMAARLEARAIGGVRVIQNWADDARIVPVAHADNPLRAEWGLSDKFAVAYSGNLGSAHDGETMLDAAARLREHPDIVFLFTGGGSRLDDLAARAPANMRFLPYQPREKLALSLGAGDVHWLSLDTGFDGLVLPSKFYGIAAAGRPIIVIGSQDGELAKLVREHDCGIAVTPGDGERLAREIHALAGDSARRAAMGANARAMLDANFTKAHALARWSALLNAALPVSGR